MKQKSTKLKLTMAVIFCMAAPAMTAEVVDAASNGFTVKTTLSIKAAPDAVYRQIIHESTSSSRFGSVCFARNFATLRAE